MDRFPDYLMDDNPWNDYRYLLGYETWMRFIPIDIALSGAKALEILPAGKIHPGHEH